MSTPAQEKALRDDIRSAVLRADDLDALMAALLGVFARHQHLAVWTVQTVRDAVTAAYLHLAEAGHEDLDREVVANALAAAGITPGGVR